MTGFGDDIMAVASICTSLQTDNHTSTLSLIFTGRVLILTPNRQCKSMID